MFARQPHTERIFNGKKITLTLYFQMVLKNERVTLRQTRVAIGCNSSRITCACDSRSAAPA